MKFSAQEEWGLRCLLRIAQADAVTGVTISEISAAEGLSQANAGKLLRILRMSGLIKSVRGTKGGYKLLRPPETIYLSEVLDVLGGKLYDQSFCGDHAGFTDICTHSIVCSVRSVWMMLQLAVDSVLRKLTLQDLLGTALEPVPVTSRSSELTVPVTSRFLEPAHFPAKEPLQEVSASKVKHTARRLNQS